MESRIPILENIVLNSVIMPYYSYTHKAFLLLSSLYSRSRRKLDDFYEEFRSAMKNYCMNIYQSRNPKVLSLPWDLFRFNFSISTVERVNCFIEFLSNLKERKGYYFNTHFMHQQIWLTDIVLTPLFIEKILPYVEDMKQINTFLYSEKFINQKYYNAYWTLHDAISLNSSFYFNWESGFDPSIFFLDEEKSQLTPCYSAFNKIEEVSMWLDTLDQDLEQLQLLKQASIKLSTLDLKNYQCEDIESYTNPSNFKYSIKNITMDPKMHFRFSDKTFENITDLKLKHFKYTNFSSQEAYNNTIQFNLFKILSMVDGIIF